MFVTKKKATHRSIVQAKVFLTSSVVFVLKINALKFSSDSELK